jgi:hypothetical protein
MKILSGQPGEITKVENPIAVINNNKKKKQNNLC